MSREPIQECYCGESKATGGLGAPAFAARIRDLGLGLVAPSEVLGVKEHSAVGVGVRVPLYQH
jgi:hypothetical protein